MKPISYTFKFFQIIQLKIPILTQNLFKLLFQYYTKIEIMQTEHENLQFS